MENINEHNTLINLSSQHVQEPHSGKRPERGDEIHKHETFHTVDYNSQYNHPKETYMSEMTFDQDQSRPYYSKVGASPLIN